MAAPFVTVTELMARWHVNCKTILGGIKRGDIPCTRIGQRFMIPRAWMLEREREGVTAPASDHGDEDHVDPTDVDDARAVL